MAQTWPISGQSWGTPCPTWPMRGDMATFGRVRAKSAQSWPKSRYVWPKSWPNLVEIGRNPAEIGSHLVELKPRWPTSAHRFGGFQAIWSIAVKLALTLVESGPQLTTCGPEFAKERTLCFREGRRSLHACKCVVAGETSGWCCGAHGAVLARNPHAYGTVAQLGNNWRKPCRLSLPTVVVCASPPDAWRTMFNAANVASAQRHPHPRAPSQSQPLRTPAHYPLPPLNQQAPHR